jgi:hypothetical protein
MEPAEVNANRFAQLSGGQMSLEEDDFWTSEARGHLVSGLQKERAPATVGGNPLR